MEIAHDSYSDILDKFSPKVANGASGLNSGISSENSRYLNNKSRRYSHLTNQAIDWLIDDSRVIHRINKIIPDDAGKLLPNFKNLSPRKVKKLIGVINKLGILAKFQKAGFLANKYGAAYILLDINDGKGDDKPVDTRKNWNINKCYTLTQEEVRPDGTYDDFLYDEPEYFRVQFKGSQQTVHTSRILAFYGEQRHGRTLLNYSYFHKPVWESAYSSYLSYLESNSASLNMLKDASVGIYSLEGLHQRLAQAQTCDEEDQKATEEIYARLSMLADSATILNKLILDKDKESYEYVERNYAHITEIIADLRRAFTENVDLPDSILFSTVGSVGMFSDSSVSDREMLALLVNRYQIEQHNPNYKKLFAIVEGGTEDLIIEHHSTVHLTLTEQAKFQSEISKNLTSLVMAKIISPQTAAKRLSSDRLSIHLDLSEEEVAQASNKTIEVTGEGANQGFAGNHGAGEATSN